MLKEKSFKLSEHFESVLNAISDGILISDGQGMALWVNQACLSFINRSDKEVIGKHSDHLEKEGVFNPSVTSMVLREQAMVSTVQLTENKRQFMVSGYPIKDESGQVELIITHSRDITSAVRTTSKLEEMQTLLRKYSQEIIDMNRKRKKEETESLFIGKSKVSLHMVDLMDKAAVVDATILITGETGVGKSEIARKIHHSSERSRNSLVEINCGALPDSLIESELFGYKKGAFTGADKGGKKGLIAQADGGTLFLDEIGELPIHLQAKLLQFLQHKKYTPIGDTKSYIADARVIAATNRDLPQLVKEGKFRPDLYYRLNVLPIKVPSLRERREDIFELLHLNLKKLNKRHGRQCKLSPEALQVLQYYRWPGNIRELEHLIERLVITVPGSEITPSQLKPHLYDSAEPSFTTFELESGQSLPDALEAFEREIIEKAYEKFQTTRKAAEGLGISQSSLMRRLKKYKLTKNERYK